MVCVGAPIVEELVYRGLFQGSFAARFNHVAAWIAAAVWFAVIHFRPVEYPGLFAFGLVVKVSHSPGAARFAASTRTCGRMCHLRKRIHYSPPRREIAS